MDVRRVDPHWLIGVLAALLPVALIGALLVGSSAISWQQAWQSLAGDGGHTATILWQIRLPRVVLAAAVGAVLALCGAVMQGLFRNPLADPSLIGVSSGASVGASVAIVLVAAWLPGLVGLPVTAASAFLGGLLATLLVYRLATSALGTSVATMLLAGIAITALAGAAGSLLSYFADNTTLRRISLWQMGSLSGAGSDRAVNGEFPFCCESGDLSSHGVAEKKGLGGLAVEFGDFGLQRSEVFEGVVDDPAIASIGGRSDDPALGGEGGLHQAVG